VLTVRLFFKTSAEILNEYNSTIHLVSLNSSGISVYLGLFNSYENHWPGAVHKMYLVNSKLNF
jgi:hypothetical protein